MFRREPEKGDRHKLCLQPFLQSGVFEKKNARIYGTYPFLRLKIITFPMRTGQTIDTNSNAAAAAAAAIN